MSHCALLTQSSVMSIPTTAPETGINRDQAAGKRARSEMPRKVHAKFTIPERDAVAILEQQHVTRLPELVPVRIGRMLESPFAYIRGTAAVMAHDLSASPRTGRHVVACGDAHIANFGLFASPERKLLFDLNDFDEAHPGPWEWDVKRLAASVWINGRNNSYTEEQCLTATTWAARAYRQAMAALFELTATERYYYHVDLGWIERVVPNPQAVHSLGQKARSRTSEQLLAKLTTSTESGAPRIVDQPPILRHVYLGDPERMADLYRKYQSTLRADTALLLSQYELVDYAMRIVGVGSVGTRCFLVLLIGPAGEALFLQAKEAGRSVLHTHGHIGESPGFAANTLTRHSQGYRVVGAQRILQAQSDPFLGWVSGVYGMDGARRDYYLRQFRDMKGSVELGKLTAQQATNHARLCGAVLARAHSQSPGSAFITGYLGRGDSFDTAVAQWARCYADQAEKDHAELTRAVESGRLRAERGV